MVQLKRQEWFGGARIDQRGPAPGAAGSTRRQKVDPQPVASVVLGLLDLRDSIAVHTQRRAAPGSHFILGEPHASAPITGVPVLPGEAPGVKLSEFGYLAAMALEVLKKFPAVLTGSRHFGI